MAHDAKLLADWDHTAPQLAALHNLTVTVLNIMGKSRAKPRNALYFHPFREYEPEGMKVNAKNIGSLKLIALALSKS